MKPLDQINARFASLTPANQVLARYIMKQPKRFLTQTAAQIAAASGVSAATVVRFIRQLDYPNLQAFKLALVQAQPQSRMPQLDTVVHAADDLPQVLSKLASFYTNATNDLATQLDLNVLAAAIAALQRAKAVHLFGIGASGLAAQDLYMKLLRAGIVVHTDADVHAGIERLYYAKASRDLVIIYSYSGMTKEVLVAAAAAKAKHLPLIAITRRQPSPLATNATWVIGLPADEPLLRIGAVTSLYLQVFAGDLLFFGAFKDKIAHMEKNFRGTSALLAPLKTDGDDEF